MRIGQFLPSIPAVHIALIVMAVIVQLPALTSVIVGDRLPTMIVSLLYKIGTSWFIGFLYFFLIFALFDILFVVGLIDYRTLVEYYWWIGVVVVGLIVVMLFIGNINYYKKKRVELTIDTKKNMSRPLKIVFSSDWHLGYGIGGDEVAKWVELINAEKPDIVLIGGDLIDNYTRPLWEANVFEKIRQIRSRYGVFTVLGNHEYFGDTSKRMNFFEESGVKILRDRIAEIKDLCYIIGREDASRSYRASLRNLTDTLDHTKPIIVIDHQPSGMPEAMRSKVDLLLSGHTHAGQVFPLNIAIKAFFRRTYGYYRRCNTHFYVTSGLGIWGGKFRIGTRSEYVVINLK